MRVGDQEWRRRVAQLIRDTRRIIGRDFARDVVAPGARLLLSQHLGEECIERRELT